jgi:NhaA family Na+:H+ antiporter
MRHPAATPYPITLPDAAGHRAARAVRFVVDRYLLLPLGALVALLWANTASESYFRFSHAVAFPVNEIAMAFFLALVAQEVVEAMMPRGALHGWRRWTVPLIAAAGGVAGAVAVYVSYVSLAHEIVLRQAWPVACAIDVAAAYYVLKLFWPRSAALPFVLLLGLATDAFGVLVVALRPSAFAVRPGAVLLMLLALAVAGMLRRLKVRSFWPYLFIAGPISWWALYWQDIHPALALIPIVPFLPREPRSIDLFADARDDDDVHHFEHRWNELVQVVLFFFGVVNAGVLMKSYDTGSWALLAAALVGRPVGIVAAIGAAVSVGLRLPRQVGLRELSVIALATSSGFTFALLFATGLLPPGPVLMQVKFGALTTVAAAGATIALAWLLRVGQFARRRRR